MAVEKGNKVKVDYTGSLEDGTVFDTSEGRQPLEFEAGAGQMIKGFDEAVMGMEKDEEKEVKLASEDAYGAPKPELLKKFPKEQLPPPPEGQEIKAGMMLTLGTNDGHKIPAKITEVSEKDVTIDMNHPLAGKALNFKIKVVDIQ